MTEGRRQMGDGEILLALIDLLYSSLDADEKQLDQELEEAGFDLNTLQESRDKFIAELKRKCRYKKSEEKMTRFRQFAEEFLTSKLGIDRRALIKSAFAPSDPELALVFNRNLNEITNSYLESLSDEAEVLDIWVRWEDSMKKQEES